VLGILSQRCAECAQITRMGSLFFLEERLPKEFGEDTQYSIVSDEKVIPARQSEHLSVLQALSATPRQ
jgi:hypothetical protein